MTDFEAEVWEPDVEVTDWQLVVESRMRRVRAELEALDELGVAETAQGPQRDRLAAHEALGLVETVLRAKPPWWRAIPVWWSGWRVERAWRALHEAESYSIVADPQLAARLPAVCERVAPCLPTDDQRRLALEALRPASPPSRADRIIVRDAVRAAFDASDEAHAAGRALRNKLAVTALALIAVNTLLGMIGLLQPQLLPLCATGIESGARRVCAGGAALPGAADVWLVQMLGAVGATVAAVVLLVRRRPSLSPYVLSGYQALIKVLLGAVLAVIGVLALGAGLAEGLVCLRTQAAVLLWAVVLGYSQQLGTRLLDNYADRMLNRLHPLTSAEG